MANKNRVNQTTGAKDNIAPRVNNTYEGADAANEQAANGTFQDNPADRTYEDKTGPATEGRDTRSATRPQTTPRDINSPTVTGFTAEDRGLRNAAETPGLRRLDMDEASNLRQALSNVIGYQTGANYRHDFESGLEVLKTFGFSYNVDRADTEATQAQEDALQNERGQVLSADESTSETVGSDSSKTDTSTTEKTEINK